MFEIEIIHSVTGHYVTFTVDYPEDYTEDEVAEAVWQDTSINVRKVD
jgi:hypothetical protein